MRTAAAVLTTALITAAATAGISHAVEDEPAYHQHHPADVYDPIAVHHEPVSSQALVRDLEALCDAVKELQTRATVELNHEIAGCLYFYP